MEKVYKPLSRYEWNDEGIEPEDEIMGMVNYNWDILHFALEDLLNPGDDYHTVDLTPVQHLSIQMDETVEYYDVDTHHPLWMLAKSLPNLQTLRVTFDDTCPLTSMDMHSTTFLCELDLKAEPMLRVLEDIPIHLEPTEPPSSPSAPLTGQELNNSRRDAIQEFGGYLARANDYRDAFAASIADPSAPEAWKNVNFRVIMMGLMRVLSENKPDKTRLGLAPKVPRYYGVSYYTEVNRRSHPDNEVYSPMPNLDISCTSSGKIRSPDFALEGIRNLFRDDEDEYGLEEEDENICLFEYLEEDPIPLLLVGLSKDD